MTRYTNDLADVVVCLVKPLAMEIEKLALALAHVHRG
jgi:hypothetical protein